MIIDSLVAGHYRIPLPTALSDSTHGTMTHFELITVRLSDRDGAEGMGYTYTVGAGGAAVHALIEQDLKPVVLGAEGDRIEALWQRMWWHLHYGGRGGLVSFAVAAVDIALVPNRSYLEAHGFGLDPYLAEPLQIREGFAVAPERSGHGVQLDWRALGGLQVR